MVMNIEEEKERVAIAIQDLIFELTYCCLIIITQKSR